MTQLTKTSTQDFNGGPNGYGESGADQFIKPNPPSKVIHKKLKEIHSEITKSKSAFKNDEELYKFLDDNKYTDYFWEYELESGYDNLLHMMAEDDANKEVVKSLIEIRGDLMEAENSHGLQPLAIAINRKNEDFISAVLDSDFSKADVKLAELLDSPQEKENSIHKAIKADLNPLLTIRLIDNASETTLEASDGSGKTALHYAVEYDRCFPDYIQVVRALLRKNDAALDKSDCRSVFRHHMQSREKYQLAIKNVGAVSESAKAQSELGLAQMPTPAMHREVIVHSRVIDPKKQEAARKEARSPTRSATDTAGRMERKEQEMRGLGPKAVEPELSLGGRRQSNVFPTAPSQTFVSQPANTTDSSENTRRWLIEKRAAARKAAAKQAALVKQGLLSRKDGASQTAAPLTTRGDIDTANVIAKDIKMHYLRSIFKEPTQIDANGASKSPPKARRNHDKAIKFLYGQNKDNVHICFSFLQGPSKMSADKFKTIYGEFNFDSILQFVAFRRVQFTTPVLPPRKNAMGHPAKSASGGGRKDMEIPFKWLHDDKKVQSIMKVIVDDLESPSHCDESIETALKPFEIEILDWRKIDLCPETICNACQHLREVHLWWSGNNALLRAWSEPDGLVNLLRLERIHIHQIQTLESDLWMELKFEEFKRRLKKARDDKNAERKNKNQSPLPDIHVFDLNKTFRASDGKASGAEPQTDAKVQRQTHKWLRIMDTFADGIARFEPQDDKDLFGSLPDKLKRNVKIALIDDGVQFGHDSLQGKIVDGWSFDDGYDTSDLPGARKPFHESQTGHGTLMANMICRICPGAKIFVCRLKVIAGEGQKSHFTAESAAEAVEYCSERDFDIISMSWTVLEPSGDEKTEGVTPTKRIENALSKAYDKGALLFCAAPDEGSMTDSMFQKYFPVGCLALSTKMFKIGAATANNVGYERAGDQKQLDFILPGHEVSERGTDAIEINKDSPKTGSSVATALAAGFAAVVIQCVRLAAIETHRTQREWKAARQLASPVEGKYAAPGANDITDVSLDQVKTFNGMRRIFSNIRGDNAPGGGQNKFLEVNSTFEEIGKTLCKKDGAPEDKVRVINYLARNFVGWAAR